MIYASSCVQLECQTTNLNVSLLSFSKPLFELYFLYYIIFIHIFLTQYLTKFQIWSDACVQL